MARSPGLLAIVLAASLPLWTSRTLARPGELIARYPFQALAPQDIAWDGNIYYVTSFLDSKIHRYEPDLRSTLPALETPFDSGLGLTGIAFNGDPKNPRLWVVEPLSREIREIELDGNPTGRVVAPLFEDVVNDGAQPIPRGMAFDPRGDEDRGSFYIVESLGSLIYEVDLNGSVLRKFSHPDDPDGFPGKGATAPGYDLTLIRDGQGLVSGFYVTGGRTRVEWIKRLDLDGAYHGLLIPVESAGGTVSGFLIKEFALGDGSLVSPAVIATVESSAELVVLDGTEESIGEIFDVACSTDRGSAVLSWKGGSLYDRIELYRDCELRQTLPGTAASAVDAGLGAGVYRYSLKGWLGPLSTETGECTVVIGGGRVLRSVDYEGRLPVDLAVDERGYIYISDYLDQKIHVYSDSFDLFPAIDLAFLTEEDRITGLAYDPTGNGSLFVYNSETNIIVELNRGGDLQRVIPVTLPNDAKNPRDKALVAGMAFDPRGGADQAGAFWIVELVREMVYALDREGKIIRSFPHPAALESPVPPLSSIHNYMGALSESPGPSFERLDLSSGTIFEEDVKRIIRVDARTGKAIPGLELTLAGQDLAASSRFVGIQHAMRANGTPALYLTASAGKSSKLMELDPTLPEPKPLTGLAGRQRGRESEVALTFLANDSYDRIRVDRDCLPLSQLAAGQFQEGPVEFVDRDVPPGLHRYDVRGVKAGVETQAASVQVNVGTGAILGRAFAHPVASPIQLTRDPIDGSFLMASNSNLQVRSLYRFRADLTFAEELAGVLPEPWEVATMAVRPGPGADGKIYVIAWSKPTQVGGQQTFPMYVLARNGDFLEQIPVAPPRPPNGFITYPTGLAWDAPGGVFYYLERNSDTIVRMDPQGNTLALIRHPSPPVQSYVFNLGLSVDPENGGLFLTSAGPEDHRITTALQLTRGGRLTGLSVPLGDVRLNPLTGIAVDGPDLVVCGFGAAAELIRLQAFHPLAPPLDLHCAGRGSGALLSWRAGGGYEQVAVLRDGQEIAMLPGEATSYLDTPPSRDRTIVYSVLGRVGGHFGKNSFCELPAVPAGFIRGDADSSGQMDLTDAVTVLNYLFLGGPPPLCDDAADADDSGEISITDAIRILGRLFLGDRELPPPSAQPGQDPTPDPLSCS